MRGWQRRVAVASVTVVALTLGASGVATAQADDRDGDTPRVITVQATGLVRGTPDVLELTLGVDTRAKSAGEALDENSRLTLEVLKVLDDAGVDGKDVQTSDLSISPVYDDDYEVVIAYAVSNHVRASLHDLSKAGDVVDAATKAAGDQIVVQGLSFSINDNSDLVATARADAVKRAKAQAEQLADAAGAKLGELVSITESTAPVGPAIDIEASAPRAAGDDTSAPVPPIQPGSEQLSVDVTLVYAID
jgi:hypothetical protein